MVFNMEPAVYLEGWGGLRQCELVAVTDEGVELLTPFNPGSRSWRRAWWRPMRRAGATIPRAGPSGCRWWGWRWRGSLALYLALYQWGAITLVWEPFFGRGSIAVLHSPVSRVLLPDAAAGALGYVLDGVSEHGGTGRWRTPTFWIVVLFGLADGRTARGGERPPRDSSQPVLLTAWCTLCLASAAASMAMIGPAMDEVLASLQHLWHGGAGVGRHGRCSGEGAAMWPGSLTCCSAFGFMAALRPCSAMRARRAPATS